MSYVRRLLLIGFVCLVNHGFGQAAPAAERSSAATPSSAPAQVVMPTDPVALLELARDKNGIAVAGGAPWHLKASFDIFDESGAVKEKGTFEEFRFSEEKYKVIISSPSFSQTEIGNDTGRFVVGDRGSIRQPAELVRQNLLVVVPSEKQFQNMNLSLLYRKLGAIQLKCISVVPKPVLIMGHSSYLSSPLLQVPTEEECFSLNAPAVRLRVTEGGYHEMVYNQVGVFRGRYVALDSGVQKSAKPLVHMHIDTLETLKQPDEALLIPPSDAISVPKRIKENGRVLAGNIVKKVTPQYPSTAKMGGVQGIVVLHAIIGRDGKIADLEPIGGPKELNPPSMNAVRQWTYKPYLLDGEPVEVETTINVVFSLGG